MGAESGDIKSKFLKCSQGNGQTSNKNRKPTDKEDLPAESWVRTVPPNFSRYAMTIWVTVPGVGG